MNKRKRLTILFFLSIVLGIFVQTGCSATPVGNDEEVNEKPIVAVTIVPQKTFVEAVAGDLVEVVTALPPGSNHESYDPSPKEMEELNQASLYFTIGVGVEEANILPNLAKDIPVIFMEEEVASVYPMRTFASGEPDPHIWLSPKRAKVMVELIARELSKIDLGHQAVYMENAQEYLKQLDQVDEEIQNALAGVTNKKIMVYHPAFGYLTEDYGLEMVALEEEGKEATAKHLQEMVDLAKAEEIKVIFYQEEIDSRQSEAFAEEIGAKTIQLAPLAADYIDNLKNMANLMAEAM